MEVFSNLSTPGKITIAGVPIAATAAADTYLIRNGMNPAWVILFSILVLVVVAAVLWFGYRAFQKRKAQEFKHDIDSSTRRSSSSGQPEERAAIEATRRRFIDGFEEYKREGMDPYEVPWYLVMGEPGSGKTYAVRNSGIGFLSGMQDERQGTGGTKTMDWWFTKSGVLLDTAGRWSMGSGGGQTLASQELAQFLRLLKKHRAKCPINGLILVLDGARMQNETEAESREKAKLLSEALFQVKRELDVRFPVIVWISKCDTIPGFRSYFQSFADVRQQQQMLGWSNPAENIDEPFHAEQVEDFLKDVVQRLRQRRWQQMYDVSLPGDARRVDAVDSLFVFPSNLEKLSPSIRLYLEIIFGDMRKAPFLRGIYFNSAITEGAEVDSKIAEAMGLTVEQYAERSRGSGLFRQDRSFFIRDTLAEKLFKEKNLVTRATNAVAAFRRTQIIFVGVLFLCLVGMTFSAYMTSRTMQMQVGKRSKDWRSASEFTRGTFFEQGANQPSKYIGDNGTLEGGRYRIDVLASTLVDCGKDIQISLPFRWFVSDKNFEKKSREEAWKKVYRENYFTPLLAHIESASGSKTNQEKHIQALVAYHSLATQTGKELSDTNLAFVFEQFLDNAIVTNHTRVLSEAFRLGMVERSWMSNTNGVRTKALGLMDQLLEEKLGQLRPVAATSLTELSQTCTQLELYKANSASLARSIQALKSSASGSDLRNVRTAFETAAGTRRPQASASVLAGTIGKTLSENVGGTFAQMKSGLAGFPQDELAKVLLAKVVAWEKANTEKITDLLKQVQSQYNPEKLDEAAKDGEAILRFAANLFPFLGDEFSPPKELKTPLAGWNRFTAEFPQALNAIKSEDAVLYGFVSPLAEFVRTFQRGLALERATQLEKSWASQANKWPFVNSPAESEFTKDALGSWIGESRRLVGDVNALKSPDFPDVGKELIRVIDVAGRVLKIDQLTFALRWVSEGQGDVNMRRFMFVDPPGDLISLAPGATTKPITTKIGQLKYQVGYADGSNVDGAIQAEWGLLRDVWEVAKGTLKTNATINLRLNNGKSIQFEMLGISAAP